MADQSALRAGRPEVDLGARPSATDRFVAEQIEPRYEQLNSWPTNYSHAYLLRRAAKRFKIHVKRITDANRILFHSGVAIGGIDDGVTSLVSYQARRVCRSRALTKRYLMASELPTPVGKLLHQTQFNTATRFWERLGGIATVRPSLGQGSEGATARVTSLERLRIAWAKAIESAPRETAHQQILVESYHHGLDLQVFVTGEEVAGALVRVPMYILGDGHSTLGELADAEVARRNTNSQLSERTPTVTDELLRPKGLSRQKVPRRGKITYLTESVDVTRGGALLVDVLDMLSEELKQLAIDAAWAVPGLGAAGVDLLAPTLESAEGSVVVGLRPEADIAHFRYPDYGKMRLPQHAVMDHILAQAPNNRS